MVRDVVEKVGQKDSKQSALDQHEARSTLCPAPPVVRGRPVSRILAERSTDAPFSLAGSYLQAPIRVIMHSRLVSQLKSAIFSIECASVVGLVDKSAPTRHVDLAGMLRWCWCWCCFAWHT